MEGVASELWHPKDHLAKIEKHLVALGQPARTLEVASEVSGRILSLPVEMGSEIETGQFVAIESEQAELQLKLKEQELLSIKLKLDSAKSHTELMVLEKNNQEREWFRVKALYEKGSVSLDSYEQKELSYKSSLLRLEQAHIAQHELIAKVKAHETQVKLAEELFSKYKIILPAGWVVSRKHVELTTLVTAFQPMVSLADLSELKFEYYLTQLEIEALLASSNIVLELHTANPISLAARLHGIDPVADMKTQKSRVELRVDNRHKKLTSGVQAMLLLNCSDLYGNVEIPQRFIKTEFEQSYVYDANLKRIPIKIRMNKEGKAIVAFKDLPQGPLALPTP